MSRKVRSFVGHRDGHAGSTAEAMLQTVAAVRWRRPAVASELAQHVLGDAEASGADGLWLRAAGWLLHTTAAVGDAREAAIGMLAVVAERVGADRLGEVDAARLRIELAALAQAGGDLDLARRLLGPGRPTGDAVGDVDELERVGVAVRCALVDDMSALPTLRDRVERIAVGVDHEPAAFAELLVGSMARAQRRPAVAATAALRGLAHLSWTPDRPTTAPSSPHLGYALLSQWVTALVEDGSTDAIPEAIERVDAAGSGRHGVLWQLALARALSGRSRRRAAGVLEDAAAGAAAADAPSLEAACRSAEAELHEGEGRLREALAAMRASVRAERLDRERAGRLRSALTRVLDGSSPAEPVRLAHTSGTGGRPAVEPVDRPADVGHGGPAMSSLEQARPDPAADDASRRAFAERPSRGSAGRPPRPFPADRVDRTSPDELREGTTPAAPGARPTEANAPTVPAVPLVPTGSAALSSDPVLLSVSGPGGHLLEWVERSWYGPGRLTDGVAAPDSGAPLADALVAELHASALRSDQASDDGTDPRAARVGNGGRRRRPDDGGDAAARDGLPSGTEADARPAIAALGPDPLGVGPIGTVPAPVGPTHEGTTQPGPGSGGSVQVGPAPVYGVGNGRPSGQVGPAQAGSVGPGSVQAGPVPPGSLQVGPAQPESAQPASMQPGSMQPGSAQDGTAQASAVPDRFVVVLDLVDGDQLVRHPDTVAALRDVADRAGRLAPPSGEVVAPGRVGSSGVTPEERVEVVLHDGDRITALLWSRALVELLAARVPRRDLPAGTDLRARVELEGRVLGDPMRRPLQGSAASSPPAADTGLYAGPGTPPERHGADSGDPSLSAAGTDADTESVERIASTEQTGPVEQAGAVTSVAPIEQVAPIEHGGPIEQAGRVAPAERAEPAAPTGPVERAETAVTPNDPATPDARTDALSGAGAPPSDGARSRRRYATSDVPGMVVRPGSGGRRRRDGSGPLGAGTGLDTALVAGLGAGPGVELGIERGSTDVAGPAAADAPERADTELDPTAIPDGLGIADLLAGAMAAYRDI